MSHFLTDIKEIAEGLTVLGPDMNPFQFRFVHCEPHEFNTQDDDSSPFVFLYSPLNVRNPVSPVTGQVDSIYQCQIFFGIHSKLHQTQEERQANLDRMETAKDQFITDVFNHDHFDIEGEPSSSGIFNDFDLNCDGWYLKISIRLEDVSPCVIK